MWPVFYLAWQQDTPHMHFQTDMHRIKALAKEQQITRATPTINAKTPTTHAYHAFARGEVSPEN